MASWYDISLLFLAPKPRLFLKLQCPLLTLDSEQGYEVVCFLANVGQEEDWEAVKAKAVQIGATKMYVLPCHGLVRVLDNRAFI